MRVARDLHNLLTIDRVVRHGLGGRWCTIDHRHHQRIDVAQRMVGGRGHGFDAMNRLVIVRRRQSAADFEAGCDVRVQCGGALRITCLQPGPALSAKNTAPVGAVAGLGRHVHRHLFEPRAFGG